MGTSSLGQPEGRHWSSTRLDWDLRSALLVLQIAILAIVAEHEAGAVAADLGPAVPGAAQDSPRSGETPGSDARDSPIGSASPIPVDATVPLVVRLRNSDRLSTLPRGVFRIDFSAATDGHSPLAGGSNLYLGAGFGVRKWLELGFGLPSLNWILGQLEAGPMVYAATSWDPTEWLSLVPLIRLNAPANAETRWFVDLGAQTWFVLGPDLQFFVSPTFSLGLAQPLWTSLALPAGFLIQASDRLFVTIQSGITFEKVDIRFSGSQPNDSEFFDEIFVPLGAAIGWTLTGPTGAVADIQLDWVWNQWYIDSGSQAGFDWRSWTLLCSVNVYGRFP